MKKILLSSIILFLFSVSIVLFQISCKKEAVADVAVGGADGKILFSKYTKTLPEIQELWSINQDGTNLKKININLPIGFKYDVEDLKLSQDSKKIFFKIYNEGIYSCSIDGGNLTKILEDKNAGIWLNGIY